MLSLITNGHEEEHQNREQTIERKSSRCPQLATFLSLFIPFIRATKHAQTIHDPQRWCHPMNRPSLVEETLQVVKQTWSKLTANSHSLLTRKSVNSTTPKTLHAAFGFIQHNMLNSWEILHKSHGRKSLEDGVRKIKMVVREIYSRPHWTDVANYDA
jgi:hypothetical protein